MGLHQAPSHRMSCRGRQHILVRLVLRMTYQVVAMRKTHLPNLSRTETAPPKGKPLRPAGPGGMLCSAKTTVVLPEFNVSTCCNEASRAPFVGSKGVLHHGTAAVLPSPQALTLLLRKTTVVLPEFNVSTCCNDQLHEGVLRGGLTEALGCWGKCGNQSKASAG